MITKDIPLISQPVIAVHHIEKGIDLSTKAANDLVRDFMQPGIIKEITGYKRNRFLRLNNTCLF